MSKAFWLICVVLGLGAAAAEPDRANQTSNATPPASATHITSELRSPLQDELNRIRKQHQIPALGAVAVHNDTVVELEVVGARQWESEVRATRDDKFHIGSLTKSMTASVVAGLVAEGELSWDSTVAAVFPELVGTMNKAFESVTLQQLLSHRSGLPDDRNDIPLVMRLHGLEGDVVTQRLSATRLILSRKPACKPGTAMVYSNSGYLVAAAMAERAMGESWETLMRERLFEPLGMTASGFGPPGAVGKLDAPSGHRLLGDTLVPIEPTLVADNPRALWPAGAVHCSLEDLARYASAHIGALRDAEDKPLLPDSIRSVLHDDPERDGYALGWGVSEQAWTPGQVLSHAGSNTMWFAVIKVAPESGWAFAAVTNAGTPGSRSACVDAIDAMIRRAIPVADLPAPIAPDTQPETVAPESRDRDNHDLQHNRPN